MDDNLIQLLALTMKNFMLLNSLEHLVTRTEILVARLEAKDPLDNFCKAEGIRLKLHDQLKDAEQYFKKSFNALLAHLLFHARLKAGVKGAEAAAQVAELLRQWEKKESDVISETPARSTETVKRQWGFRYACPDGTVVYAMDEDINDVRTALTKVFGDADLQSSIVHINDAKQYATELRVLYGTSSGSYDIPRGVSRPVRRRCLYRIACPDSTVHYANGGIAYDRLYATLKLQHKMSRCEIAVALADKIPPQWLNELKRLYGTADGSYNIPFPDEPPKRPRRRYSCPSCKSPKVRIVRTTKHEFERECRKCSHRFVTPKNPKAG